MNIQSKIKALPNLPGVYFHKDKRGEIIYIGKAANLRNRIRQYFQKSRVRDPKTDALVKDIEDIDWIEVETELDALFLEAEFIRRYMPRYNILLRDDKSLSYVRINYDAEHPTVSMTRRPLDDGSRYFGPYFSGLSARRALKYLRKVFPYSTHTNVVPKRACLQYHLGLCPGLEEGKTNLKDYRENLKKLMKYLRGQRVQIMKSLESDMKKAAAKQNYEAAARYRNQLLALKSLAQQVVFGDREFLDISKDQGLSELMDMLRLNKIPRRIEGYDISHMQGTDNVASMVVFVNGVPDKAAYRKFKLRLPGNDDFAHIKETLIRRLSQKNQKSWEKPNLILVDGGKGQLAAAIAARDEQVQDMPIVGLAKREEEIIIHKEKSNSKVDKNWLASHGAAVSESNEFISVILPKSSHAVKLLQRIRDESHRFAVSYHSVLKSKRQTASMLDDIPTIGPSTRKKLLKAFGSINGVIKARDWELEKVAGIRKAAILKQYLRPYKRTAK